MEEKELQQQEEQGVEMPPHEVSEELAREVQDFVETHPQVKKLPDEVAEAFVRGVELEKAYSRYEQGRMARLEEENRILRQNAEHADRAPVRGVTGAGHREKGLSDFEKGFLAEAW